MLGKIIQSSYTLWMAGSFSVQRQKKDLGVFVHKDLKFEQHINETVKKANKTGGIITHCIQYKHKQIMVPCFRSLVRPILAYGIAVWALCLIEKITRIENVQRRFTKRITGMNNLSMNKD